MAKRIRNLESDDYEFAPLRTRHRTGRRPARKRQSAMIDDLRDLAADLEIAGYQRMEMDDLIRAIRDRM